MTLDLTTFDPMLKDHYAPGPVQNLAYAGNKAFGMLKKSNKKQAGGRKWIQPIGYALPGGGSSTFATANSAVSTESLHDAFEVTHVAHYRVPKVNNQVIKQTAESGDLDAFEPALNEFDKAIKAEANWINHRFFRGKGGAIGRLSTGTTVSTVNAIMQDRADVWQVRKGDIIRAASTDGTSGALRAGSLTVASVLRKSAQITMTLALNAGIAAIANTDWLFLDGDFGLGPAGLATWIPDNNTDAATTLFSCDRSVDPEMLSGRIVDGTASGSIYETIIDMVVEYDDTGGDGENLVLFLNPFAAGTLTKQLEGKWEITQPSGVGGGKIASVGYRTWNVTIEGHEVKLVTDRSCPTKRMYLLDMSCWVMFVAGMAPNFLTKEVSILKISENSDGYEARVGEYFNFACSAPGYNVVGLLP